MGQSDIQKQGYPKSTLKRDWEIYLFCSGGRGGGACATVTGTTSIKFSVDVNPFDVYNQSLLIQNPESTPVRFYTDAGSDGFGCSHTFGNEVSWYLGFSDDGNLTDGQIIAQNNIFSGAPPYNIEILANKLPQPTAANWQNKIWLHIYWGNPAYVTGMDMPSISNNKQYLKILKHNFEVKQ